MYLILFLISLSSGESDIEGVGTPLVLSLLSSSMYRKRFWKNKQRKRKRSPWLCNCSLPFIGWMDLRDQYTVKLVSVSDTGLIVFIQLCWSACHLSMRKWVFMLYKQKFIVGPQDVPEANKDEPHPGWAYNQRHRGGGGGKELGGGGGREGGMGKFRKLLLSNGSEKFKAPKFLHKLYWQQRSY